MIPVLAPYVREPMSDHDRIRDAVLAARDRLPEELAVEDVAVSETTDGEGGEVVRVRFILTDAPPAGFSAEVYWRISAVLDDVIGPLRPAAVLLPGFITAAELAENQAFVTVGSP